MCWNYCYISKYLDLKRIALDFLSIIIMMKVIILENMIVMMVEMFVMKGRCEIYISPRISKNPLITTHMFCLVSRVIRKINASPFN